MEMTSKEITFKKKKTLTQATPDQKLIKAVQKLLD